MSMKNSDPMVFDFSNPKLFPQIYIPLFYDKNRTKVVYGSRSSAKSDYVAERMVIKCLGAGRKKFKCLMVRKMKEDVRESIYETLKDVIERRGLTRYFKFYEGTPKIVCKLNGNSFLPKGLNETGGKSGNAKSIRNPTDAIVDEADEISLIEYIKLDGSLRGSKFIECYLILNPPPDDHWIVKRFMPDDKQTFELPDGSHTYIPSNVKNATVLHTTYKHNPFLTKADLEYFETLEEHNPDLYETEGKGMLKATVTGGEALKHFDPEIHVSELAEFDPGLRALECWDFNNQPHHTVGLWQFEYEPEVDGPGTFWCNLSQEFCIEEASIRDVQTAINNYLKDHNYEPKTVRVIADHSGTKQIDWDVEAFTAKIERVLKRGGFTHINETSGNPRVAPSLEFLNDILGGYIRLAEESNYPGAVVRIRMHPRCIYHRADYAKTKKDKMGQLVKIEGTKIIKDGSITKKVKYQIRGHAVDGGRYMATGIFEHEYENHKSKD